MAVAESAINFQKKIAENGEVKWQTHHNNMNICIRFRVEATIGRK